jgi:hypothetical protein
MIYRDEILLCRFIQCMLNFYDFSRRVLFQLCLKPLPLGRGLKVVRRLDVTSHCAHCRSNR